MSVVQGGGCHDSHIVPVTSWDVDRAGRVVTARASQDDAIFILDSGEISRAPLGGPRAQDDRYAKMSGALPAFTRPPRNLVPMILQSEGHRLYPLVVLRQNPPQINVPIHRGFTEVVEPLSDIDLQ